MAKFSAFLVILLVFTSRKSLAKLVIESLTDGYGESSIIEAVLLEVFESCYMHRYSAVGIVGPYSAAFLSSLQSHESNSVILIDNDPEAVPEDYSHESNSHENNSVILINNDPGRVPENPSYFAASRRELQIFLVSISKTSDFVRFLQNLQFSQWVNPIATFLIIDRPTLLNQDCFEAFEILKGAWTEWLLDAKFICHHKLEGLLIYSYSTNINQAPIPWQVKETGDDEEGLPWIFQVLRYQDSQEICNDLDFDNGKDFEILLFRNSENCELLGKNQSGSSINGTRLNTVENLLSGLINSKMTTPEIQSLLLCFFIIDVSPEELSTLFSPTIITPENKDHPRSIYPFYQYEVACITQHRNLSQIEKLLRVIDCYSRYAVVFVCFITFVFFKFFLRQSVSSAILNIVRLICNAAVPNPPNNVATRIYLTGLFILVMTLQGIYQGKLASLLTKPVILPNAETFEDLENYNYTVYGDEYATNLFKEWNYRGHLVSVNKSMCVQYVLKDDSAACVTDRRYLVYIADLYDLHLSATMINVFLPYLIRQSWFLERESHILISQVVESNIFEYTLRQDIELILKEKEFHEKEMQDQSFMDIELKDLLFAFEILAIGLTGATIVFFVEFYKGRK